MSNKIEHVNSTAWRVEGVAGRHEADPELRLRFTTLFHTQQDVEAQTDTPDTSARVPPSILNELSAVNHVTKWGNAELHRGENSLSFKLLNGPMSGLVIFAQWDAQGVALTLKPKNQKQQDALNRIMPKIKSRLNESALKMTIEVNRHDRSN
ncbi:hypothetical protein [Vibrio coralliilyticus]|uniref:Flagellar hook-length control protein FliK n=1 Tax=Vibrio coralliilyticus TaxID=190893 RepID=A0AAP6ZK29_9VIBR|nr:hypothetical protein [Vibrio coralliilyticus]NOJ23251.1 hypothetical protein [Vibrio coralliilyticus]